MTAPFPVPGPVAVALDRVTGHAKLTMARRDLQVAVRLIRQGRRKMAAKRSLVHAQTLPILTLAGALAAGPTLADDDCFVAMADWQPREAVERLADEQGWAVRRIKIDDGCYEIKGSDAKGSRSR